jgi:hypothetical protein
VLAVAHSKGGVVQVPPPPPPCSPTAPQLPRSPPPTCPRRCRSPAVLAVALGRGGIVQVPPLPPPCSPTALWPPRSPPRRPIVRSLRVAPARAPPPRCQKRASSSRPAGSQTLPPSACRAARLLRHSAPPRAHAMEVTPTGASHRVASRARSPVRHAAHVGGRGADPKAAPPGGTVVPHRVLRLAFLSTGGCNPTIYSTVRVAVTVTSQRQTWQASGSGSQLCLSTDVRDACRVLYPYLLLMISASTRARSGQQEIPET